MIVIRLSSSLYLSIDLLGDAGRLEADVSTRKKFPEETHSFWLKVTLYFSGFSLDQTIRNE